MIEWVSMPDVIPEGKSGNVAIEHFEVDEASSRFTLFRAVHHQREFVAPGKYCRLLINNDIVMSDTQTEKNENREIVTWAHGDVLIAGLGLGVILFPILRNAEVDSVTVIEKNPDVIKLVYAKDRFPNDHKLTIIQDDIFTWIPPKGKRFNVIYFDIWTNLCTDNLVEITKLKRKFSRRVNRTDPKNYMFAWEEGMLRRKLKRDKKHERSWRW